MPESQRVEVHSHETGSAGDVQYAHIGPLVLGHEGGQTLGQTALTLSLQVLHVIVVLKRN